MYQLTRSAHNARATKVLVGIMLCLICVMAAPQASADTRSGLDEDSPGRLDVRGWGHEHLADGVLRHSIEFEEAWDPSLLSADSEDRASLAIGFRVKIGDRLVPMAAEIRLNSDGSYYAPIFGNGRVRGFANISKPDPTTLYIDVASTSLKSRRLRTYFWSFTSRFTSREGSGDECEVTYPNHPCLDSIPYKRHRL